VLQVLLSGTEEQESTRSRHYGGFDSALYRKLDAEWHLSQENATLHDFKMATVESKPP
jgi:hypothetical protein